MHFKKWLCLVYKEYMSDNERRCCDTSNKRTAYFTCFLLHSFGISVKIIPRESYEIGGICFLIIEAFLEILTPNLQPRFDVELCLTWADSEKHRYNSKRIPQFETTNYLAKKKRVQSIEIRRQTFSELWVERNVIF